MTDTNGPTCPPANPYDVDYLALMDTEAQDAEPNPFREGDTPPTVPGVTIEAEVTWWSDGQTELEDITLFLPTVETLSEASLLYDLLSAIGPTRRPHVILLTIRVVPTPDFSAPLQDWMRGALAWSFCKSEGGH